jgi:hypothetical protein
MIFDNNLLLKFYKYDLCYLKNNPDQLNRIIILRQKRCYEVYKKQKNILHILIEYVILKIKKGGFFGKTEGKQKFE